MMITINILMTLGYYGRKFLLLEVYLIHRIIKIRWKDPVYHPGLVQWHDLSSCSLYLPGSSESPALASQVFGEQVVFGYMKKSFS
ncbi:hypothetical protein AAY473_032007, partial [Plecturocebus cupreus]